jgi:hypothetical protein
MTKKPSKTTPKTTSKTTSKKKPAAKKAPSPKKTATIRPADADRLQTATEAKQRFVSAENLMKAIAEQPPIVRANDIKSSSLRKRMLAWFRASK